MYWLLLPDCLLLLIDLVPIAYCLLPIVYLPLGFMALFFLLMLRIDPNNIHHILNN